MFLAEEWDTPFLTVRSFINARMNIAQEQHINARQSYVEPISLVREVQVLDFYCVYARDLLLYAV